LLPQGLAALATTSMLKQTERIRETATIERERLNTELGDVAEKLSDLKINFPVKAGETGKLYGSITTAMIADSIEVETGAVINRDQIDTQPIKMLGVHVVPVRLTIDLIPELTVVVYQEGEAPESAYEFDDLQLPEEDAAGTFAGLQVELDAEDAAAAAAEAGAKQADEAESEAIGDVVEPVEASEPSEPSDPVSDEIEGPSDETNPDLQEDH